MVELASIATTSTLGRMISEILVSCAAYRGIRMVVRVKQSPAITSRSMATHKESNHHLLCNLDETTKSRIHQNR